MEEKTSLFSFQATNQPKSCAQTSFCMQGGKKQEAGWGPWPSAREAWTLRAPTLGEPRPVPPRPSAPRSARRKAGKRGSQETGLRDCSPQTPKPSRPWAMQTTSRTRHAPGETGVTPASTETLTLDPGCGGAHVFLAGQRTELLGPEPRLCGKAPGRGS